MSAALESIKTLTQALERSVELAGIAPKVMADRLGIGYCHYVRMMRHGDPMNFPPDLIEKIMVETRNILPLEWLAWRMGYRLHEKSLGDVLVAIREALDLIGGGTGPHFSMCENGTLRESGHDEKE